MFLLFRRYFEWLPARLDLSAVRSQAAGEPGFLGNVLFLWGHQQASQGLLRLWSILNRFFLSMSLCMRGW